MEFQAFFKRKIYKKKVGILRPGCGGGETIAPIQAKLAQCKWFSPQSTQDKFVLVHTNCRPSLALASILACYT